MAKDRFKQYQYALVRFFRNKGFEVNSLKKTIRINPDELNFKDLKRLKELEKWGFKAIGFEIKPIYSPNEYCDSEESFIDFADEVLWMHKHDLY